ncbi:helix-turn-helix protein [Sediminihabitans luteus]|uniref:Helix-turn-helix protein n=1 Tax=Sediminihabitans luteus TaxID=1138585 RepID=A0A2M9CD67_9CELL|nr:IS3 family transposase [Sediminihabitans luteus]PJJ69276.1 helix-turn-helix protein [Sediminihabitans luteus]GII98956.1 hypothetical protein Slu03_13340 [Sediminihabitans luteus]
MSRFQFVADHQSTYSVKRLCQVLEIARSSFYKWLAAAPARAARLADDEALAARIRAVHDANRACGAPRITADLNYGASEGERVNHKRVARVMRERAIVGLRLRRRVRTTVPDPHAQLVPDLLERDFTATEPNTPGHTPVCVEPLRAVGGSSCTSQHGGKPFCCFAGVLVVARWLQHAQHGPGQVSVRTVFTRRLQIRPASFLR